MTVVACKIPTGVTISANGKSATIVGYRPASPSEMLERHQRGEAPIPYPPGGYAFTENVDDDLWATWAKDHADSDMIQKGLIFGADSLALAHVVARSKRAGPSGLESSGGQYTFGNHVPRNKTEQSHG